MDRIWLNDWENKINNECFDVRHNCYHGLRLEKDHIHFKNCQECINWLNNLNKSIEGKNN